MHRFTPLVTETARPSRHSVADRWFMDETYVRIAGVWPYVHRAVDQHSQVIDVFVPKRRNVVAATKFFEMMLSAPRMTVDLELAPHGACDAFPLDDAAIPLRDVGNL